MNVVMTAVGSLGAMLRVATVAMQDPMDKYVALCRSLHWIAEASVMFDLKVTSITPSPDDIITALFYPSSNTRCTCATTQPCI